MKDSVDRAGLWNLFCNVIDWLMPSVKTGDNL